MICILNMKNQEQIDKKFLYKENKQLRIELKQAKELIKLHKDAVERLSQLHISKRQQVIPILLQLINSCGDNSKINQLKDKILGMESKQMVLEKMIEQADNDEKETYHMLAEEYNKIKQDNDNLEKKLHKFYEKIGEVDYLSGLVTKFKQVIIPTEQAVAFKKEQQQLLQFIGMQKQTIRKLTEQKNKLLKINILMKQSVEKHKDEVRNMTMILNSPDMLMNLSMQNQEGAVINMNGVNILDQLNDDEQRKTGNPASNMSLAQMNTDRTGLNSSLLNMSTNNRGLNTTMNFIKMQRKIIKEEEDEAGQSQESEGEYECPELNVLFPDKVEKIKKDREITKVPYLNMMKIRELMAKKDNKMRKQIQAEGRHINPTDKIIKLETQLDITRKQLTSQTLKFRTMSDELKSALKLIDELQNRNDFLINSYERLSSNYKNMYNDYQFTKIVALRVEKALGANLEDSQCLQQELNASRELQDRISTVESILRKVLGKKVVPVRSQSLER